MKKCISLLAASVLYLVAGNIALAEQPEHGYGVTPYLGFHYFNDERGYVSWPEFGLKVEKFIDKTWSVEGSVGYVRPEIEDTNKQDNGVTFGLNGIYNMWLFRDIINPYLMLGIGGDTLDSNAPLGPDAGVGIRLAFIDKLALRFELRDVYLFSNKNDVIALAGIDYRFGAIGKPKSDKDNDGVIDDLDSCPDTAPGTPVNSKGCPLDSDEDGVTDDKDSCPDTPRGDKVDAKGCSRAVPGDSDNDGVTDDKDSCPGTPRGDKVDAKGCTVVVPEVPKDSDNDGVMDDKDSCLGTPRGDKVDAKGCTVVVPKDSDNDGVTDDKDSCLDTPRGDKVDAKGCTVVVPKDADRDGIQDSSDKCPDTPAGITVDSNGCPVDSDKDGVPDYLDKCPNSPSGARVDNVGCVTSITLKINFDTGKWDVKEEYYPEIKKFADFMIDNTSIIVEIQGHTDNVGNDNSNMKLSDNRANAVMKALVDKFSVPQSRISAKGYGETKQIDSNKTPAGRSVNRRVEAVVVK